MNTTIDNHEKKDTVHSAEGVVQENVSAVNSAKTRELYNKRQQIYPKNISGTFRKLKWAVLTVLLGIYYILPFLRWPREGSGSDQFVLADFEHRRFYFGPIEIWPQEVYYITGLLILAGVGLFLATSLFGRVWCGYACPQTVWTDLFIWVEQLFEGDRNQRIRLDKAPWSFDKAWRKIGKHTVWLIISLMTGGWFVMYFNDAYEVLGGFLTGKAPFSAYVFAGSLTFTTYALAGTLREQVCTFMCPWPRIQAAMLDHEALSVTYKHDRGEPRGPHKKGQSWEGRGDCVDCRQCIAVCPAGIDIREGLQIECINCALCIDACDEIMDKVGRPRGLIGYDTEDNINRRLKGQTSQFNFIRPRTIFYGTIFAIVSCAILYGLLTRHTMGVNVIRDRAPLFVTLSDGSVRNAYTLKILNMSGADRNVAVSIEGVTDGHLEAETGKIENNEVLMETKPNKVSVVRMFMVAQPEQQKGKSINIKVKVRDLKTKEVATSKSVFITGTE
ncbi:cytochrome c oxidase accessory protein CcoG [Pseudaquidulcibacter saccharophilus]|uniref:cytochrome c oxidase accessory protein CcoG n=1 Tax=Pseudaquidulcibacter saccharophilus TaxID=2831900 RepID=UPI001EFF1BE0|nr:cytochrome c oxidase accessory protein CcoG [Pseudaquidulcibacter saccharophilus]